MTTHHGPQGAPQDPSNPQQQPAYWPSGNHAHHPPPMPPQGYGAWIPTPPEPPRKKGGKWKWALGVLAFLVVLGMINGGNDNPDNATAAAPNAAPPPAPITAPVPAAAAPAPVVPAAPAPPAVESAAPQAAAADPPAYEGYGRTTAKYGEKVDAGGLEVTAAKPKKVSQEYLGTQVCSTVSYRNTGQKPESFNPFDWKFRTASGVETSASIPWNAGDKALNSGQLTPGGTTSGLVCGDQQTLDVTSVVYNPGFGILHEVTFTR